MTNLARIVARRADFDTCQVAAWTDGFPIIGLAVPGGVVAGPGNVGDGALTLSAVAGSPRRGAFIATVTGAASGLILYTVTDPDGDVVGNGVSGLALDAGGLRLTLTQGLKPFAVGDAFAVSVLTDGLDLTGLFFRLDARLNAASATLTFQAASAYPNGAQPTLLVDPARGAISARLLRPAMSRQPPGDYPYTVVATDPVLDPAGDEPVIAFYGTIRHRAVLTPSSPQA